MQDPNELIEDYKIVVESLKQQRNSAQDNLSDYQAALTKANRKIAALTEEIEQLKAQLPAVEEEQKDPE